MTVAQWLDEDWSLTPRDLYIRLSKIFSLDGDNRWIIFTAVANRICCLVPCSSPYYHQDILTQIRGCTQDPKEIVAIQAIIESKNPILFETEIPE